MARIETAEGREANVDKTNNRSQAAERSFTDLDGHHGDPSTKANWIRERQLAEIVIGLLDRIKAVSAALKEPRV